MSPTLIPLYTNQSNQKTEFLKMQQEISSLCDPGYHVLMATDTDLSTALIYQNQE